MTACRLFTKGTPKRNSYGQHAALAAAALLFLSAVLFDGCAAGRSGTSQPKLRAINIVDRNGMTETVSNEERLQQYRSVNFCMPQPYQKVLRVYSRDGKGDIKAYVHSYHNNSQPRQYLEVINSRAHGFYREWHENGRLKLQVYVIGGEADLSPAAEKSWLFDGQALVWNEEGMLTADIAYSKGTLHGNSVYYHDNGNIWRKIPFNTGVVEGSVEVYLDDGRLFQKTAFEGGMRQGSAQRYWGANELAADETYHRDALMTGRYYDINGNLVSEIREGNGCRAIFGRRDLAELHQYRRGFPEGEVKILGSDQKPMRVYHVKNGEKHGEEVEFYDLPHLRSQPKLSVEWYEGKIQGLAKTWYENGVQESKREMSGNTKHGVLTAWYRDGNLMIIEEYEKDKLVKGEYYRKGDKRPFSTVDEGNGTVTLFDPEGNFVRKIVYERGRPNETT